MRVIRFLKSLSETRDTAGALVLGLAMAIAVWLVGLSCWAPVQRATLARFHLVTDSFAGWAGLQVIPPMYNLENRYWFRGYDSQSQVWLPPESGYLNHFPTRVVTFFDNRWRLLQGCERAELTLQSRFQNQLLQTRFRLEKDSLGVWQMLPQNDWDDIPELAAEALRDGAR